MTRSRVEDLGRLMVMLDQITDSALFSLQRAGEFVAFYKDSEDKLYDLHHEIELMKEKIYECLEIAQGEDRFNEEIDGMD